MAQALANDEPAAIDAGWVYLNALADAVLVARPSGEILYANLAAEQFLGSSAPVILSRRLTDYFHEDSPVLALIEQAQKTDSTVAEYDVTLLLPRLGSQIVTVQASPIMEFPDRILVTIREQSIAKSIDRQLSHQGAARSVTAMASMLAHEVKNPLSGIRGAAQLLEPGLDVSDRSLTRLICDEADRIVALVDRMDIFADERPIDRQPVNIHQILQHVREVAAAGFAKNAHFTEEYDPSLPPVFGNRDLLIQVFLNLVKNAAEAIPHEGGEIRLATAYRPGVRLAVSWSKSRVLLPLVVTIQDNGAGIPEEVRPHLFDPFVTTKTSGSGLGLALVAKIIHDHGGVIEFSSDQRGTAFHVMLPLHRTEKGTK